MSNRQPSINIYRPVDGIGQEQLEVLCDWALDDGGLIESDLKVFLRPVLRPPRAKLIDSDELRHFHDHPDLDIKLDRNVLNDLQDHVEANLPLTAKDDVATELLPAHIHNYKKSKRDEDDTRDVLKVATSEVVMIERLIARLAVCDFFGLDAETVPEGIWLPDEHVASVHFARGDTPRQKEALRRLEDDLKSGNRHLSKIPKRVILREVMTALSED